jgi:chemotaxis response regulator CheB
LWRLEQVDIIAAQGNHMAKPKRGMDDKSAAERPIVVAIGASAGGVGALQRFFANTPD